MTFTKKVVSKTEAATDFRVFIFFFLTQLQKAKVTIVK